MASDQMNEWLKLGSGKGPSNDRLWVVAAAAGIDPQVAVQAHRSASQKRSVVQPYLRTVSARLTALKKTKGDVMRPSDNAADLCHMASNRLAEATLAGV